MEPGRLRVCVAPGTDATRHDDCPDDNDDTPAPPEGGDEPCGLDCWEPPGDDDDPFNPPGFMSVQSWQTTSSGMAVAVYQPASADCPGEDDDPDDDDGPCVPAISDLETLFPDADQDILETLQSMIEQHGADLSLTGELETAHFLGQVSHETGGLVDVEEDLHYTTAERILELWPNRFSKTDPDLPDPNDYLQDAEKLANYVYANRLGNGDEESGDGWTYRGRGVLQVTFKGNYEEFDEWYSQNIDDSQDFVDDPSELESDNEVAALSGMWYYHHNVISRIDEITVEDVTDAINPEMVGQDEREGGTEEAEQVINCQ